MTSVACCGGFIDSGNPAGTTSPIGGIDCYVAPRTATTDSFIESTAIVVATDIFGYKLPNSRLIADSFAKDTQFLTVVPDIFEGTEPPPELLQCVETLSGEQPATLFQKAQAIGAILWHAPAFMYFNPISKGVNRIRKVIETLRQERGIKRVALIGYCWGGRIAVILSQEPGVADAVCSAHPGGLTFPDDIEKIQAPIHFVLADKDRSVKEEQITIIRDVLGKKNEAGRLAHQIDVYPGTTHGFAVRGNENDPKVKAAREKAYKDSLAFFKENLAKLP
ncbi:dienelactone hydrolase [Polychytrium aggregatum]|uniref:dienelactone hydrolase n=1 Tax=Polychytrium aggregatum TaxID=110093 RepID=UPI0022FE398A|nr:dienelactone hydrolase [Polychytrium aggregatum]KAI9203966.1 dienelactone hydrolase [Polychytrium aggregatum]